MTKAKKIITNIFCLILMVVSIGLFGMPSLSKANAATADISSLFVRDALKVTNNKTHMFVYDELDTKIKQIDLDSETISITNAVSAENVTNLTATDNYLFVLKETIEVYDANSLEKIETTNSSEIASFENFANISLFNVDSDELLILLTPKNGGAANLTLVSFNIQSATFTQSYMVTFKETFISENLTNGITAAYVLSKTDSNIQIIIESGAKFYTFVYAPISTNPIDTWTTLSLDEESVNLSSTVINDEVILITLSNTRLSFYTYNQTSSPALISLGETEIENVDQISVYGDNLILTANQSIFGATSYTLSKSESEPYMITATLNKTYANTDFALEQKEISFISYFKLKEDQTSYTLPYTSEGTLLESGTNVALLSIPTVADADFGYSYCLAVSGGKNVFGYINSQSLEPLEPTVYEHDYVYVIHGTYLYNLPSNIMGAQEGNQNQYTISMDDKVKVISSICDAQMGGREFLLVEVNGKTGFILRDRVYGKYVNYNLIVTNAYLKSGVNVYKDADTTSEIVGKLSAGDRLKVIETRRIDSEFLKVTYNDVDGNEVTGYVLASCIETDSWSMLQILGMVLVIINLIFLLIILAVRKKINKD